MTLDMIAVRMPATTSVESAASRCSSRAYALADPFLWDDAERGTGLDMRIDLAT